MYLYHVLFIALIYHDIVSKKNTTIVHSSKKKHYYSTGLDSFMYFQIRQNKILQKISTYIP
jgi:hypothetical protein